MPNFITDEERKERLAYIDSPERAAMVEEVSAYLAASHLSAPQLATYINYSHVTLRSWLGGNYHRIAGTDKNLVRALRAFIDANPIVATAENQGTFYQTENVATLQSWFDHCLSLKSGRGRMVCVYSGPGGQKTFITENLVARFNREQISNPDRPRAFHLYCSQDLTPGQLVVKMLVAAGIRTVGLLQKNLTALRFSLRQCRTLFIFDEAQHLSIPCLEIIRELNDLRPYFGVMLLGSHRLRQTFEQRAAEMEQWHSRLTAAIELPGISEVCARHIVECELAELLPAKVSARETKLRDLVLDSYVDDIYSREKRRYLSARRLFRSIELIKEAALAKAQQPTAAPATQGVIQ
jgi:DNA transposition AAA+ family ATPase